MRLFLQTFPSWKEFIIKATVTTASDIAETLIKKNYNFIEYDQTKTIFQIIFQYFQSWFHYIC